MRPAILFIIKIPKILPLTAPFALLSISKGKDTMPEYYLGIDVGIDARRRTTGLCLITVDQTNINWRCLNTSTDRNVLREDLRNLVPGGSTLSGVGIDGPLAVGLGKVCCYRAAEALLSRGHFQTRCKPGQTHVPIGQRLHHQAIKSAALLLELQIGRHLILALSDHTEAIYQSRIVEAFPTAFLACLLSLNEIPPGIPRRQKSNRYWEIAVRNRYLHGLIEHLAAGRKLEGNLNRIKNRDHRAAFVCALSAMCVSNATYIAVGSPYCGDIFLPPREVWRGDAPGQASWVETTLCANVFSVRSDNRQNKPCEDFNQARVICNGRQWIPEIPNGP